MLLEISNAHLAVAARTLIEIDHLEIHKGDRIGLIGKNGSGKTTFLQAILNNEMFEKGEVNIFTTIDLLPQLKQQIGSKSGGEITQNYIQQAFTLKHELLLADEPTTHLDKQHIEWVEKTFKHWQGAFVVVSHDRSFLDTVCNKVWELDQQRITEYKGNYQQYQKQKKLELLHHQTEYEKYQSKKQQLERALRLKNEKAARATKKPKNVSTSEASITGAKPYFAKKQKKLQQTSKSIETRLEKLEKVDKPYEEKALKMSLPQQEKISGRTIIRVENLDGRIGNITLWEKANFHVKGGDKVAIIGNNGSGKTTLIRKLLNQSNEVQFSPSCQIAYFKQDLSILNSDTSILENIMADSLYKETLIRTVLARLHFYREDVHKKVDVLSGGEKVKVTLAKIFLSNSNTLLLDEPTNFLDIEATEALEQLLIEYEGTILFVSHDRRFVERVATKIVEIKEKKMISFDGDYREYLLNRMVPTEHDDTKDKLLAVETKITEVLGRLSIEPSEQLEKEFQDLLKKKQRLSNRRNNEQ
ncbi:pleuromutilin/lincosamide/streptogramin A transport system ATP-binding/permease protein [Gracilibacillus kekensis]|uniref:Pleuromutilin/lincosamide/streptogramin A transport system ATP-binding/permease protein n=2 Tax=Gracilibacillus kekensis TaxID=1027249 RepID=A0A1M7QJ16_9BACI|nr:ABC-F type ribosomal protection protein [Gracilibacillus kekensis]SHN30858.1 pleuromutilin/lincosamide/streptogramin A transport system ATP-binding/permease protein [Gracilibacillus kekensis]